MNLWLGRPLTHKACVKTVSLTFDNKLGVSKVETKGRRIAMPNEELPLFLAQGEKARLFPVLSLTSKEGRATSILLGVMQHVPALAQAILKPFNQRVGQRSRITCFTEVVFKSSGKAHKARPDGLIEMHTGRSEWNCLVEAKIGNASLEAAQIEEYRAIAKENKIDALLTLSNQFTYKPDVHPLPEVTNSKSKVLVIHWSWLAVATEVDLLLSNEVVTDAEQVMLLSELKRFLSHESTGVKGFDRMPPEWSELNKLVSAGGTITAKNPLADASVRAWQQEMRDLSLLLTRETRENVTERLPKKWRSNPDERYKAEIKRLCDKNELYGELSILGAAAPLEINAVMQRRVVEVGMTLNAPDDKKSNTARLNWLLRQLKNVSSDEVYVTFFWPGSSQPTTHSLAALQEDANLVEDGKQHLQTYSFRVFISRSLGGKFAQQQNFITELEQVVPDFYASIGQNLKAWQKPAPKIDHKIDETEHLGDGEV